MRISSLSFFARPSSVWALMFCAMIIALAGANTSLAATLNVTNNADSGAGTLRAALAAANHGDTIRINILGIINLTSGELVVDKSVRILGTGVANLTISGSDAHRIFAIGPDVSVSMFGVTLSNGLADEPDTGGGAIYNLNSTLTLSNCAFTDNAASELGGGAIFNHANSGEARCIIADCTFSGSTSAFNGGAIYNRAKDGVAIVDISNATFAGNTAFYGGAIANHVEAESGRALLHISSASITDSEGTLRGGAIDNFASSTGGTPELVLASLTVSQVTMDSGESLVGGGVANTAESGALALAFIASTVITANNVIDDGGAIANQSLDAGTARTEVIGSSLVQNMAGGRGGAIFNAADAASGTASVMVVSSTVSDNSANEGAGLFNFAQNEGFASVDIRASTFNANAAADDGGAMQNHATADSTALLTVVNSTISGNQAVAGGGLFNFTSGGTADADIRSSTFSENTGFGASISNVGVGAAITLQHTILNAPANNLTNTNGLIISLGFNLAADAVGGDNTTAPGGLLNTAGDIRNTDPLLAPLQDNGGATFTHALAVGSPAIDAGDPTFDLPLLTDQRGSALRRRAGEAIDIGAFELQGGAGGCRAGTLAFWRKNPAVWPVTALSIAGRTYDQNELLAILTNPPGRDASLRLARALIVARLNIANGTSPLAASGSIARAENLLAITDAALPQNIDTRTALGKQMSREAKSLLRWRPLAICTR